MQFNPEIKPYKDDMVESVRDLIRIDSQYTPSDLPGAPFGVGIKKALDYCLNLADYLGFKTQNLDGWCGYAEYGEGSSYVAAFAHLDTVAPLGKWNYEPFKAKVSGGKIYGLGAIDNKGPAVTLLYALKAIKDSGLMPGRKIRIIFGTDEEGYTGEKKIFRDIEHYLSQEPKPLMGFTVESTFPAVYAEKGLIFLQGSQPLPPSDNDVTLLEIKGGEHVNTSAQQCVIRLRAKNNEQAISNIRRCIADNALNADVEETSGEIRIVTHGLERHSGYDAIKSNAIVVALRILGNTENLLSDELKSCFGSLANALSDPYGKEMGIDREDEFSGRLTLNVCLIACDGKDITIDLDVRYPVSASYKSIIAYFEKLLSSKNGHLEVTTHMPPIYYPPQSHFVIQTLLKAYREVTGDDSPAIATGLTSYAKTIPNVIPFGPVFPGQEGLAHSSDECIRIKDLVTLADIYARALFALSNT